MKATIMTLDGTVEEFRRLNLQQLLDAVGATAANGHAPEGEQAANAVPDTIRQFIEAKASQHQADLFVRFVRTVLGWGAVKAQLGGKMPDGDARYVRLNRIPQRKGAFVYVSPRNGWLTFRLRANETPEMKLAVARKHVEYQVRIDLASEAALSEAMVLAQLAFDRSGS